MAVVSIGLPVFEGGLDDDIEVFIDLYQEYLHGIGIDTTMLEVLHQLVLIELWEFLKAV